MPQPTWGPALPKHRELITYVEGFEVDPFTRKAKEKGKAFDNIAFTAESRSASALPVSFCFKFDFFLIL